MQPRRIFECYDFVAVLESPNKKPMGSTHGASVGSRTCATVPCADGFASGAPVGGNHRDILRLRCNVMSEVQAIVFTCQNQERRDTAPSATILKMVALQVKALDCNALCGCRALRRERQT